MLKHAARMKIWLILFGLVLLAGCDQPHSEDKSIRKSKKQKEKEEPKTSYTVYPTAPANVLDSVVQWLPEREHEASLMNGYSPRSNYLSEKMGKAVTRNQDWFFDFVRARKKGEWLPFHPNLGLTKAEYEEFIEILKNIEVFSTEEAPFGVHHDGREIHFSSSSPTLVGASYFAIDIEKGYVVYTPPDSDKIVLQLTDTIRQENPMNVFRSRWHGYRWEYMEGTVPTGKERNVYDFEDFHRLKFTLGRMEDRESTFILIDFQGVANGERYSRSLPLLIR